ncbi:hypothetical protein [Streptacidiphilus sp. P02-A3a]|uniref:hypothetical protein n=1 Tax=Streptacidiphilus sp. P02-A3a TaxID=2704468 RepID=UPI0015FBF303|nr:hypothetical protein [Streptacidiphilus sp. P02-A3a]QMU66836.1 hypothetical protein GXP74_37885 [Streptacidiphilus sp. P02-A3a]
MAAHDQVALAEIDLYGELMIAAAATPFERLPADLIDEVLRVAHGAERRIDRDRYREIGEAQVPSQALSQGKPLPRIPAQTRAPQPRMPQPRAPQTRAPQPRAPQGSEKTSEAQTDQRG